jgi:hypothetical protein
MLNACALPLPIDIVYNTNHLLARHQVTLVDPYNRNGMLQDMHHSIEIYLHHHKHRKYHDYDLWLTT